MCSAVSLTFCAKIENLGGNSVDYPCLFAKYCSRNSPKKFPLRPCQTHFPEILNTVFGKNG